MVDSVSISTSETVSQEEAERLIPSPLTAVLMVAGLAPFVFLALWCWIAPNSDASRLLNIYSFGIVSFMVGTWWQPLAGDARAFGAVVGNGLFLLAAFALVLIPEMFALVAAILLLVIYTVEQLTPWIGLQQTRYRRYRLAITIVASACLMLAQVATLGLNA